MRVLALDLGSSTGFAIGGADAAPVSGTWQVAPTRGESPGMRYVRLRGNLEAVRQAYPDLRLVVYEQAHHRGGAATEYCAGCAATVQAWCAERGIDHTAVHSATLKKWATGRGNAKKDEMQARARVRFGRGEDLTDDEADALWLLDYARGVSGGPIALPGSRSSSLSDSGAAVPGEEAP